MKSKKPNGQSSKSRIFHSDKSLWFAVSCLFVPSVKPLFPPLHIHNDEHNISGMVTAWCLAESAEPSITHHAPPDDL